jgi:large subunit ribosomal protein L18Ae
MYKEYRELTRADAVKSLYQDMAARHRARFRSIHVRLIHSSYSLFIIITLQTYHLSRITHAHPSQILRVVEVEKTADVRRPYIKQLLEPGLRFPLPHRVYKSKSTFSATRPVTFS